MSFLSHKRRALGLVTLMFLQAGSVVVARAATEEVADAKYLFAIAHEFRHEADYKAAREAFEAAVAADSDDPYLRLSYAEFLYQLGDLDAAVVEASALEATGTAYAEALRLRARIRLRQAHKSSEAVEEAVGLFQELRALLPDDVESRVSSGRLLMSLGRFDEAVTALREAWEIDPGDRRLTSMLMAAFENSEDRAGAESGLRELVERSPGFLDARLALANLLAEEERHEDSVAVLEAGGTEQSDSVGLLRLLALELYRVRAWQESLDASERWLELAPNETPAIYLKGLALSALGRFSEAEAGLRGLHEADSKSLDVARVLAEVVERQGRSAEAGEILSGTASRLDDLGQADLAQRMRIELIDLEVRAENWDRVIELTEELSQLSDSAQLAGRGELELLRGQALLETGRAEEAIEVFEALGEDAEVGLRARARAAEALFRAGESDAGEAKLLQLAETDDMEQIILVAQALHRLELYERAIPLWLEAKRDDPEELSVRFWLGSAYERSGRREPAIQEFRDLLARDDLFAPALNYLGYMWAEEGENLSEAADLVEKAVALEPNNGAYADSLGWVYFQQGEYDEALGHLEKAAQLVGDDAVVFEHLGDLYLALGRHSQAAESYQRAMDLEDDNQGAVREKLDRLDRLGRPVLDGDS